MTLTGQIAVFLGATVLAVPLFRRLRLSSILAYLAAGVAIGPFGLAVIEDAEGVMHIAEFGVVLLLFVIGLELQPSRLRALRRSIFGLGLAQVTVTTAVFTTLAHWLGLPMHAAFVTGFAVSLSSTPLVLQLLAERRELNTQHGRPAFAVLLFQDIAVMPMLAILPMLGATGATQSLGATLLGAVKGLAVLALLVFGGRYVLRPILRFVAETKVAEVFTAAALLVVIGTALLVDAVGMSMALGAFVAGLLLAESEYRHELEADIEPFKGLLLGLFFISVGMAANISLLLERPLLIAALVVGLMIVKAVLLWGIARVAKVPARHASPLAVSLAQGGEFGFVLFSLAVSYGVMEQSLAQMLVIVVTISMACTPLLIKLHGVFVEPHLNKAEPARDFDLIEDHNSRVLIAGFGRVGQIIARVLRMRRISFTALEASVAQVDFVRRFGNKVYYGDPSRLELLQAAGAGRAEIFVLAMDDIEASVRTAELIQKHFPNLKVFARARNRQHAIKLMDLGVRYFMRETYFSSLDMAQNTLEALGLSRAEALESIRRFDAHDRRVLELQRLAGDDEQKLIQSAQQAARELEDLFEEDVRGGEPTPEPEKRQATV
ncbi:monovalent cation:proton antiporter-2 (CPA2) family protein [Steroidobacter sp.]|uniref:monovalent cation:proton antiporter-2 (CPA2) family protein n=1 Tax=Steroidobacter sp. TaxID=1978227 RepID=UPI001A586537|nr:monovalent cation:proton antiporter-2 (CPA2) family protein [Steroidobacter sp.]MBL8269178.1 cation:proton antiporter [Steroidobacter sp.]